MHLIISRYQKSPKIFNLDQNSVIRDQEIMAVYQTDVMLRFSYQDEV